VINAKYGEKQRRMLVKVINFIVKMQAKDVTKKKR
jgi:hypothetical protein